MEETPNNNNSTTSDIFSTTNYFSDTTPPSKSSNVSSSSSIASTNDDSTTTTIKREDVEVEEQMLTSPGSSNFSGSELPSPLLNVNGGSFSFGNCRICSDKATGIHYGAASCEACKGFYKRCTLRKEKYVCFAKNNCKISVKNRGNCKACRLRRCVEAGMSLYGVKMGRIPAAVKHQITSSLKTSSDNTINFNPNKLALQGLAAADKQQQQQHKVLHSPTSSTTSSYYSSHHNMSPKTSRAAADSTSAMETTSSPYRSSSSPSDDQIIESLTLAAAPFRGSNLMSEAMLFNLFAGGSDPVPVQNDKIVLLSSLLNNKVSQLYVDYSRDALWMEQRAKQLIEAGGYEMYTPSPNEVCQALAMLPSSALQNLMRFATDLPGLHSILNDTKFRKHLDERRFEVVYVKTASLYINEESYYYANDKVRISNSVMESVFGAYYTREMRDFARLFNSLNLTTREQGLICALLLTAPDDNNPNAEEFLEFQKLYSYYMRAILYEFDLNRRDTSFLNKLSTILVKLSLLGKLNKQFQQQNGSVKNIT